MGRDGAGGGGVVGGSGERLKVSHTFSAPHCRCAVAV